MECTKDGVWVFSLEDNTIVELHLEMAYRVLKELIFCEYHAGEKRSWRETAKYISFFLEDYIVKQQPIEGDMREFLKEKPFWGKREKRKKTE